ncbi:MAG: (d)CMP kinase, partial [Neisseriaceae bacterium]|nr:(d)CMP kinase [Neisseriaceae bacterium]
SVAVEDEIQLAKLAAELPVEFLEGEIYLYYQLVTNKIRAEEIGLIASQIAMHPKVRTALLERQKEFAKEANLVADGRDMGSVVFPEAQLKVYLTASAEERAKRRVKQLGLAIDSPEYQKIYQDILARDERDKNRTVAPLKPAQGAKILDSSTLSIEETVKKIIKWYQELVN